MLVGERLPALLERVDYYLGLTNTFQNEMAKLTLAVNRETISVLIAEEGSFVSTPDTIDHRLPPLLYRLLRHRRHHTSCLNNVTCGCTVYTAQCSLGHGGS
jgi:hypothetical protein